MILYGIGRNNEINSKFVSKLSSQIREHENLKIIYLFNKVDKIFNPRSNEDTFPPKVNKNDFENNHFIMFKESQLISNDTLNFIKNYDDIYGDNFISYKNLISQLSLLKMGTKSINFNDFKKIIFLRDDVFLNKKLNFNIIFKASSYSFLPYWSWCHGYNDRFFITNPNGAFVFSNRIDNIKDFLAEHGFLQGERLLKFSLNKADINVLPLQTKALRIRTNGFISFEKNYLNFFYTRNLVELMYKLFLSKLIFTFYNLKN